MRLLDSVVRCHAPLAQPAGPSRFAAQLMACPLRFVLGDDLTQASADLAYADGARLVGCLDLLRMPAPHLWIEWNDEVHKRVIHETRSGTEFDSAAAGRKVGILLRASADGMTAVGRTFWSSGAAADEHADVTLSPLETHFDLSGEFADSDAGQDILSGGFLDATHGVNPATASLLDHVRFRFDEPWAAYYREAAASPDFKRRLINDSVGSIAWDAPFVLAFLLLLSAKDATRLVPVSRAAINRKRLANGHAPLLDHVEVNASLDAVSTAESEGEGGRQSPRLHQVRGHLVRRENRVFWRVPHLRGSSCRGTVRSRTVCLAFTRSTDQHARIQL